MLHQNKIFLFKMLNNFYLKKTQNSFAIKMAHLKKNA